MDAVTISVVGTPAPQGSKRHVGGGVMVESSKAVRPWREAVAHAALDAKAPVLAGPVQLDVAFFIRRPKSHYGTGRNACEIKRSAPKRPASRPDLDKLLRSTLDGLSGIAYADDAQVVMVTASKRWKDARTVIGAIITVRELTS